MVMREKVEQALDWRNMHADIAAVVDTCYWVDKATHKFWTLPVEYFLDGRTVITLGPAEQEYEHHHKTGALDSEEVPKAPFPLEMLASKAVRGIAHTKKVGLPENIQTHRQMDYPDKEAIRGAVYFARETGKEICLVTNDTAIIGSVRGQLYNERIYLLMPSEVEEHLSHLVHKLNLQLLIKGKVLADFYKLGTSGIEEGTMPYVVVERNQEFQYGKEVLNIDIAVDTAFVESSKSIPRTTKKYGIPIGIASSNSKEEIGDVFMSISPYLHGKRKLWAILNKEHSFMPIIYQAKKEPEIVKGYISELDNEVDKIKETAHVSQRLVDNRKRELKKILTGSDAIKWARI